MVDVSQSDANFVFEQSRSLLLLALQKRREREVTLLHKGAISTLADQLFSSSGEALLLAQYEYLVNNDTVAAKSWISIVLNEMPANFPICVEYMRQAIQGGRPWDGVLLGLNDIESVLCYFLVGDIDRLVLDYCSVIHNEPLFRLGDVEGLSPILIRHMLFLSIGQGSKFSEHHYVRLVKRDRSQVFLGFHMLLLALSRNDVSAFNAELASRVPMLRRRRSSRQTYSGWGFGVSSEWCFDLLGTAACRLAYRLGIKIENPDSRWFPEPFWRD